MDALNNEISVASQEQALGIGQLSQAMTEIDQVTQTNASVAENLSSNSHVLLNEAEDLQRSADELNILLKGSKALESKSFEENDSSHRHSKFTKAA